jgi:hypothetical protein
MPGNCDFKRFSLAPEDADHQLGLGQIKLLIVAAEESAGKPLSIDAGDLRAALVGPGGTRHNPHPPQRNRHDPPSLNPNPENLPEASSFQNRFSPFSG